jgi:hypothetical protein
MFLLASGKVTHISSESQESQMKILLSVFEASWLHRVINFHLITEASSVLKGYIFSDK